MKKKRVARIEEKRAWCEAGEKSSRTAMLRVLLLHRNQIGDAGLAALAKAITPVAKGGSGALPALKEIVVPSGLEQHPQLVAVCQPLRLASRHRDCTIGRRLRGD